MNLIKHPRYRAGKHVATIHKGRKNVKYYVVRWDNLPLTQGLPYHRTYIEKDLKADDCEIKVIMWYEKHVKRIKKFIKSL